MTFNVPADMNPQGFMSDDTAIAYGAMPLPYGHTSQSYGFQSLDHNANPQQTRGLSSMDHSPHLDPTARFAPMNGYVNVNVTTPVTQQQQSNYHRSYPTSSATLSPNPNDTFVTSGPQQMTGYPNASGFMPSPHQPSGFPQQPDFGMGVGEEMYPTGNSMPLSGSGNVSYDPSGGMMGLHGSHGTRGGGGYPPTSNGSGYRDYSQ
jgi:hypothetical protein